MTDSYRESGFRYRCTALRTHCRLHVGKRWSLRYSGWLVVHCHSKVGHVVIRTTGVGRAEGLVTQEFPRRVFIVEPDQRDVVKAVALRPCQAIGGFVTLQAERVGSEEECESGMDLGPVHRLSGLRTTQEKQ